MNPYGTLIQSDYSPAVDEPLSLVTVKEFLGLPEMSEPDPMKDPEIELLIAAAREIAEEEWGGDIKLKLWTLHVDYWPYDGFRLRFPLNAVDRVRYRVEAGTWTTLAVDTAYFVDSARAAVMPAVNQSWPSDTLWPSGPIEVLFSSGYSDESLIPKKLKQGMLLLISHWFNQKLPVANIAGQPQEIPWTISRLLQGSPRP